MADRGNNQGGERVAISYKMPPNIYEKVNKLVYEEKKFSTISDCITQALIYFVDNHSDMGQFKEQFEDFVKSEEGHELFKQMMREVMVDLLSSQASPTVTAKQNP